MMKKITLLLILLTVSLGYSQTLPFDFEGAPVTGDFADFNGGTATVIANPQNNGINTSATVAQLVRDGGEVWAGSQIILTNPIDFSSLEGIRMKVFSTAPGIPVNLKIEDSGSGGAIFIELPGTTTATNAWEILEYDFTGAASGTYDAVVFLFDIGNTGDGSPSSTFLFDDVEQYDNSGGLDQIDLPIDFEGSTTNYTMTDFGGNTSTLVVDPEDAGNMVMRAVKSNVAETWAGTTFSTPAGLATDIPITAMDTKMNIRVWSPQAGLPIMLKIETAGTPTQSCETLTATPVVVGWNVLEFDFANERPGTAALNPGFVFDLGSIFFNFDVNGATAGELTFYFDDVQFGALLGVDDFDVTSFKAFPNPTQNNWEIKSNQVISSIQIFDILGKQVLSLTPNSQDATIDGSDFASGIYIAKINSSNGQKTMRLVKQ